jgi:membrane protease YdiL (CAAX protease family)
MSTALPPPIPGTAVGAIPTTSARTVHVLPLAAAIGAIGVLTVSLLASKYVLDALVDFGWPVAVYVAMLAIIGYGPSLWWCWFASRRWGTGHLGADIGLTPRLADLGWGPVVWLGAIAAQVAVGAVVVALGVPLVGNTEGIDEIRADRTYVVSLVVTAVIAAPIVEEMVFRGVVMRGLRSRLPLVAVIVLQGLLFGVAHVDPVRGSGNIGLVLVLAGVGVAFGVATALLGRIGPSIVAHAIFNGAVLLLVLTGVADRLQDDRSASVGEQIRVVDQANLAESGGDRDAGAADRSIAEFVDRLERRGIEDADVVERGERFVLQHSSGCLDHVVGPRPG